MSSWRRSMLRSIPCVALTLIAFPAAARTRLGDRLAAEAQVQENIGTTAAMETALDLAIQALKTDPADSEYAATAARIRAFASQRHVHDGQIFLSQGKLQEAVAEFDRAMAIDPAPSVAVQMAHRTREIMAELKAHPEKKLADLLMTPLMLAGKQSEELFSTVKPPPQLNVQIRSPLPRFRVNNQPSSEVFAMLGKLAKVRVLFDPEYQDQSLGKNQFLDFTGLTLEETLDYVSLITKSFWKPVSRDTILVANDDATKRALYDDQITKAFYLTNAHTKDEVNNIANAVQRITDVKKMLVHPEQKAIIVRSDPSRVALAEKLISDLDKSKAEIVIDVLILSVSKDWIRDLGVVFGLTPNNAGIGFTPRAQLGGSTTNGVPSIPLSSLSRLQTGDYAVTLPGAALNALLNNQSTKVIDKAQLRTIEGEASSLRIGQKVPYATGSFSPGGVGTNTLVNTQFSYFDVGLNIEVTAQVHEPDEVSLHIESDHSSVASQNNLGGVIQPVITQRRRVADVRVKEGEVNFWDIVSSRQSIRTASGVPGLVKLPLIGRIFTSEHREETEDQLLHLLIPHIVREPDIRTVNLAGIASGSDQVVRLRYGSGAEVAAGSRSGTTDETVELVQTLPPSVVTAARPAGAAPAGGAVAGPASLSFTPATVSVAAGATTTVQLMANNMTELKGVTMSLKYDPAIVKIDEIKAGDFLATDGKIASLDQISEAGTELFTINRPAVAPGLSGSGTIVTIVVRGLAAGNAKLSVSDLVVANGQGPQVAMAKPTLEVTVTQKTGTRNGGVPFTPNALVVHQTQSGE